MGNTVIPRLLNMIQEVFQAPDQCIYESLEDVRRDYVPIVLQVDLNKFYRLFIFHFASLKLIHAMFWLHLILLERWPRHASKSIG